MGCLQMSHSHCGNQGITHKHLLVSMEIAQTDPIQRKSKLAEEIHNQCLAATSFLSKGGWEV